MRAAGLRGRKRRRQGTPCEGYCEAMLSAPWTALTPTPEPGHTHEEHAAQGARAHECWRYLSSRVGMSRGRWLLQPFVSRLFFFASHDADLNLKRRVGSPIG